MKMNSMGIEVNFNATLESKSGKPFICIDAQSFSELIRCLEMSIELAEELSEHQMDADDILRHLTEVHREDLDIILSVLKELDTESEK